MDGINFLAILVSAFVPIIIGFLWYSPMLLGTTWMREAEMTETKMKSGNLFFILVLTFVLSFLASMVIMFLSVHQSGVVALIGGDPSQGSATFVAFMEEYGSNFRSFKHGALHGALAGVMFALPVIAINGMFERKSAKYIFIHAGYWIVSLAIMGAIICGWQ